MPAVTSAHFDRGSNGALASAATKAASLAKGGKKEVLDADHEVTEGEHWAN